MSTQASTMPNDPALADLIAGVESNHDLYAIRFEPKVYMRIATQSPSGAILRIAKINQCSLSTARMIYSTSWGAWQLMGFNWYALGFSSPITSIFVPNACHEIQEHFFFEFLTSIGKNDTLANIMASDESLNMFALKWNGSTAYADRMRQAAKYSNI